MIATFWLPRLEDIATLTLLLVVMFPVTHTGPAIVTVPLPLKTRLQAIFTGPRVTEELIV